jgi:putative glutamine amidotransferase
MESKVTIGITDCSKYDNYRKWMESEGAVKVIRLSYEAGNLEEVRKCDGVVLTGGGDVHPRFYNKNEYLERCSDIDERRDEFEWKVLDSTEQLGVPVLGICRGLQVANVYFGGTLIPDIPAFGKFDHSRIRETDKHHDVTVDPNSQLHSIVKSTKGEVNSAHHQSADLVGKGLVCNALSPDGIVEGLERTEKDARPFLMLVQWHPERMKDQASAFSEKLKGAFLAAAKKSK